MLFKSVHVHVPKKPRMAYHCIPLDDCNYQHCKNTLTDNHHQRKEIDKVYHMFSRNNLWDTLENKMCYEFLKWYLRYLKGTRKLSNSNKKNHIALQKVYLL